MSLAIVLSMSTGCFYGLRSAPFEASRSPALNDAVPTANEETVAPFAGTLEAETGISAAELSLKIKDKYEDTEPYDYMKPMYDLPKDQIFLFDAQFNPWEAGFRPDNLNGIVDVFLDADLMASAKPILSYDSEKGKIVVEPPESPIFEPRGGYDFTEFTPTSSLKLSEREPDWGYANRYYAAEFYTRDGTPLEKPKVTLFTIKRELDAPQNLEFYKDEGCFALRWDPVEGAEGYIVYGIHFRYSEYLEEYAGSKNELYKGTDTDYTDKSCVQTTLLTWMNRAYYFDYEKKWSLASWPEPFEVSVVAIGGGNASAASNPIYTKDYISVLPFTMDFSIDDEDVRIVVSDIGDLGLYRWVEMCDHSKVKMPVSYQIEEAKAVDMHDLYPDSYEEGVNILMLIPYEIKGTIMQSLSGVRNYDYPEIWDDLQALKAREDDVASKGGRIIYQQIKKVKDDDAGAQTVNVAPLAEYKVFATNALSEFIAVNMINSVDKIDLKDFPESYNRNYLVNAVQEAMYQNPYVLGIDSIGIDADFNLVLSYEETKEVRARKQNEIRAEVARVTAQIIEPGMTDIEKELAINDYLCETAEYDDAALENASENDFKYVDPEFYDSFTAYGVLINKVGVCASYAAAFKLLADEAGLECIVITGYLYGDLPHAWNRVLANGEWMSVDATNNDMDILRNPLFNIPDSVAASVLVEDNRYIMANVRSEYTGELENIEYYHIEGKFYSQDQIVDVLVEGLERDGSVTLRTDYDLNDKQYNSIVQAVLLKGGYKNLYGMTWLGLIHLELT